MIEHCGYKEDSARVHMSIQNNLALGEKDPGKTTLLEVYPA